MGEITDWFVRAARRPRMISRVYPGQVIYMTVAFNRDQDTGETKPVKRAYEVDEVYPGFVRTHYKSGLHVINETFNLGDLVMNGYESIYP